ncbi:hypothetical protein [uncultured Desulfosarcina sp.]|uniref:hypothetical protein n=1 Tax=uncultured Desulfosarcina sp. TaxID=218289 RepID=UPI0029C6E206|nr:hypothetical protein [uncultured Desulfosarcina sp.]
MSISKSQRYPGYLTHQLFTSPAFRDLKPSARDILILIYFEVRMSPGKKRSKKYTPTVTNRNEVKLTYQQIRDTLSYSDKTIWASFKEIIGHGFLKVVKHGGGGKGDVQIYGITEDWRRWEPGNVIREVRVNGKYGFQIKNRSNVGKTTRSTVGKPLRPETETGLPVGKAI